MNAARQFACAAILALLLLPALPQDGIAQEQPAGLSPSEPIWGLPPADDAIHVQPPLPALEGCCRYLPPNAYWRIAAALDGQVALELGRGSVELIDGTSGESKWVAQVGSSPKHMGWDHLFAESVDGGDMVALQLTDGEVDWKAQGCIPLGISGRSVWAAYREFTLGIVDPHKPRALLQIEQNSGDFQKVNALVGRVAFSGVEHIGGVYMNCLMQDRLLVTGPPMTLECNIDLSGAGQWDGACAGMSRAKFFVLHYRSGKGDEEEEILVTLLSCYGGLGELEWSREQRINGGFEPDRLSCMGEAVLASSDRGWGSLFFSASDGSFKEHTLLSSPQVVLGDSENDDRLYLLEPGTGRGKKQLFLLNDQTFETTPVFGTSELNTDDYVANHDWLYILHANDFGQAYGYPSKALFILPLVNGQPQPGQLLQTNFPADHRQLSSEFLRNESPLADKDLMSDVAAGGLTLLASLIEAEDGSSIARLDALAALSCYYERFAGKVDSRRAANEMFCSQVRSLAGPQLIEEIERWLNDDSLSLLHHELLGILALCGDGAARSLEEQYAKRYPSSYSSPSPPYLPVTRQMATDYWLEQYADWGEDMRQEQAAAAAAEFMETSKTASDGTVYTLYNNPGLQCPFDLYIAVDRGGDGAVEDIMATGLIGLTPSLLKSLRVENTDSRHLGLKINGETFELGCWMPVYAERDLNNFYDDMPLFTVLSSAVWGEKVLSLTELMLDSDEDGLTDIEEDLLLTDRFAADSDMDGLNDHIDQAPLTDLTLMGKEERGAARAVAYLFDHYRLHSEFIEQRQPAKARFISVDGLGPFAFSTPSGVQGVSMHDPERIERFLGEGGAGSNSALLGMSWKRPGEEVSAFGPQADEDAFHLEFWDSDNFLTIGLKDVGGELYPVYLWGNYNNEMSNWSLL